MAKLQGKILAEASKSGGILGFLSKPTVIKVHDDGILYSEKGHKKEYHWSELLEHYHLETGLIRNNQRVVSKGIYEIRLVMSDGNEITLDSKFDGIGEVSRYLRNITIQPLLERARNELAARNETHFGEYVVTSEGFHHNTWSDRQIKWDQILSIQQVGPAYAIVYKHPTKPDEKAMFPLPPMNKLPNASVLINLIQSFVAQHKQKPEA